MMKLNKFPREETDALITELLKTLPQLIDECCDKRMLEGIYKSLHDYDIKTEYLWHRFKQRLFNGALQPVKIMPYSGVYFTDEKRYHAAVIAMNCVVGEIFTTVCRVYHIETAQYHDLGEPVMVSRRLADVALHCLSSPESTLYLQDINNVDCGLLFERHDADLFAIAVFIFQWLRDRGYDWQYRSDYLKFAKRYEDGMLSDRAENDKDDNSFKHEQQVPGAFHLDEPNANNDENRTFRWGDQSFEAIYFDFVNEEPEFTVQAYKEVYGVFPDGYPPRIDHYT